MEIKLKEIADTFVDRLKNPFSGTLIIVLVFHHWSLLYSFSHFEPTFTLAQRISYVDKYIDDHGICYNLIYPVLISIGLVFVYQVLSYASKGIILFFKSWVNPLIFKIIDRNKIVTKEELDIKRKEIIQIQAALVESNDRASKIDGENQRLREKNEEAYKQWAELSLAHQGLQEKSAQEDKARKINDEDYHRAIEESDKYKKISDINSVFKGEWRLHWKFLDSGVTGEEDVYIENGDYFANELLVFKIDMVERS